MNWINKLTLKDNTVSYCFIVYMWQTLPPLLLQTVPWGPYFPLRKDCLQHYGKDKYFWVCNIIIISLWLKHLKTAIVNFFSKTTHCPFNTNWTQHCIQMKKKHEISHQTATHYHVICTIFRDFFFFTFLRRLCIILRKTWDTNRPNPATSRTPAMTPTAGIAQDLRVMSAGASNTETRAWGSCRWIEILGRWAS